ncbi:MAG: hypothetical protein WAL46_07165 [Nitrososphaeraceae archaeon]
MAKVERPEKYNWWLNELDSLNRNQCAGFVLNITLVIMKIRYDKMQKSSTVKTK